jgi:hypothetical protein
MRPAGNRGLSAPHPAGRAALARAGPPMTRRRRWFATPTASPGPPDELHGSGTAAAKTAGWVAESRCWVGLEAAARGAARIA